MTKKNVPLGTFPQAAEGLSGACKLPADYQGIFEVGLDWGSKGDGNSGGDYRGGKCLIIKFIIWPVQLEAPVTTSPGSRWAEG